MTLHICGVVLLCLGSALFGMLLGTGAEIGHYHFRAKCGMIAFFALAMIGAVVIIAP